MVHFLKKKRNFEQLLLWTYGPVCKCDYGSVRFFLCYYVYAWVVIDTKPAH
jgi:hypothetical protein